MKIGVFSIYDTKTELFMCPNFVVGVGAAVRSFGDLLANKQSDISRHPSDYILYQIGLFDDGTGVLESVCPPRAVAHGSDYLNQPGRTATDQDVRDVEKLAEVK